MPDPTCYLPHLNFPPSLSPQNTSYEMPAVSTPKLAGADPKPPVTTCSSSSGGQTSVPLAVPALIGSDSTSGSGTGTGTSGTSGAPPSLRVNSTGSIGGPEGKSRHLATLYVGNLAPKVEENHLFDVFVQYGQITNIQVGVAESAEAGGMPGLQTIVGSRAGRVGQSRGNE